MIVVDTNVICYSLITGVHSDEAERIARKDADWVAPPLWRSEFRNVLALYLRQKRLTLSEIHTIAQKAEKLMRGKTFNVNSLHVLNLVAASNCSAYDCEFIALAHGLNVPLVTFDKKILREFVGTAVSPKQFLA
ncbi:MAG: type II toxin-antitoxin system VapC family toxin [Chloroflexi bacterium]|nr:type II toxin-antitoxin system VapC family toxin [Chloroflexota bacterium]